MSLELDLKNAVNYHYDQFPPKNLEYSELVNELLNATSSELPDMVKMFGRVRDWRIS